MNDSEMMICPEDTRQLERLRAIMHRLRAPGGCPWDADQTHESLVGNLIEEAFEVVDTIRRDDMDHLKEELGDVLLQVVFHSELASERGDFDFDDVARGVSDKLVRRHPHVYSDSEVRTTDGVLSQWDEIKRKEKGVSKEKGLLHGVGDGLPSMLKAAKIQKKAGKVGFDWPDAKSILGKIQEELDEVIDEMHDPEVEKNPTEELKNEIGDLLFVTVNLARKLKLNPEELLDRTNLKFLSRFKIMEETLKGSGTSIVDASMDEMDTAWEDAKQYDPGKAKSREL